jgi:hypothetical protein
MYSVFTLVLETLMSGPSFVFCWLGIYCVFLDLPLVLIALHIIFQTWMTVFNLKFIHIASNIGILGISYRVSMCLRCSSLPIVSFLTISSYSSVKVSHH